MTRGFNIALAGLIAAVSASGCGKPDAARIAAPVPVVNGVTIALVSPVATPTTYEATGTVRTRLNATLSSKVAARVDSVTVREGDPVRAGQTLVLLDSRELRAAVDVASANLRASTVGVSTASTAATMERQTSAARIVQAQAAVAQARASYNAARSRLDLALAGPRPQERTQAHLAVIQAEASMRQAKMDLDRYTRLVAAGAIAGRVQDSAQTSYDVAKAQYDTAIETEKITTEGTRQEDVRAAREAVAQAQAAVNQSEAALVQARALALQVDVRKEEMRSASAQVGQSEAALRSAKATLGYSTVDAPFDGVVVSRLADPGTMASSGVPLISIEGGESRLETVVPEEVLAHVHLGDRVPVRFDALGGGEQLAKVTEIAPQGDASTHSFTAKLTMPTSVRLKSGMFGRASFRTGTKTRILVPQSAIWQREGLNYVYAVNAEGIARLRVLTLGEQIGDRVEVLSGLSDGERIVVAGREKVSDGTEVRP